MKELNLNFWSEVHNEGMATVQTREMDDNASVMSFPNAPLASSQIGGTDLSLQSPYFPSKPRENSS